ncbi:MAG: EVE domain-containing protein [Anaerolineae bacterium]|nr:EVE domain-containing protein [Anaerolineae bacterium]
MNDARINKSTWIFQANPNRYEIFESLTGEKEEYWNLNQNAGKVKVGDRVLIWISGNAAGIYALGTVISNPVTRPDSVKGLKYWITKKAGQKTKPRVLVRYDRVFLDNPLLKLFLECDPALWDLKVIRAPQGTNFPVSEEEWQAIEEWLDKKLWVQDSGLGP